MVKLLPLALAASAGLLLSVPAIAAEGDARLRVDQGKVMVSQGGDFTAVNGEGVVGPGYRIMLTDGATATVLYDEGCQRQYTVPGVYPFEEGCPKAAAVQGKPVNWTLVSAIGVGAILVGAAAGGGSDDEPSPPVSR